MASRRGKGGIRPSFILFGVVILVVFYVIFVTHSFHSRSKQGESNRPSSSRFEPHQKPAHVSWQFSDGSVRRNPYRRGDGSSSVGAAADRDPYARRNTDAHTEKKHKTPRDFSYARSWGEAEQDTSKLSSATPLEDHSTTAISTGYAGKRKWTDNTKVTSARWRVRPCTVAEGGRELAGWDVGALYFLEGGGKQPLVAPPERLFHSGSASDPAHGAARGYGVQNVNDLASHTVWGGRAQAETLSMFLGADFEQPTWFDCLGIRQCSGASDLYPCEEDQWAQCLVVEYAAEKDHREEWLQAGFFPGNSAHKDTELCFRPLRKPKDGEAMHSGDELTAAGGVTLYEGKGCSGQSVSIAAGSKPRQVSATRSCPTKLDSKLPKFPSGQMPHVENFMSLRVTGPGELQLYTQCGTASSPGGYWASLLELDGCYTVHRNFRQKTRSYVLYPTSSLEGLQQPAAWGLPGGLPGGGASLEDSAALLAGGDALRAGALRLDPATRQFEGGRQLKYRLATSVECSNYHAFQVQASLYSFIESQVAAEGGGWTRLMTAGEDDDMTGLYPTFRGPRHPNSRVYSPLNKPDIVVKWFGSMNAPGPDEVIVLADPDNWVLKPVHDLVKQVKPGLGMASPAWFVRSKKLVLELWRMFCHKRCETTELDMSAAPYFLHRDDLEKLAPLWKQYTLDILRHQEDDRGGEFNKRFASLQITWCVEMYGYVFAAAELAIRHTLDEKMQVRDVDAVQAMAAPSQQPIYMLHTGRSWWPWAENTGKRWEHTEGRAWSHRGRQVWCKCNYTASAVVPWPIPKDGVDFVSHHTLRILHMAQTTFPPLPDNSKYRKIGQGGFSHALD